MKKKNGWKIAFFILLAVLVIGGIIWLLGDDEEDYEPPKGSSETTQTVSTEGKTPTNTAESSETGILASDALLRPTQSKIKGNGEDTITILVYMNGSDLESDDNEATTDLQEMIAAGGSDKVNLLVQTMGTKKWAKTLGIASNRSQRWCINKSGFNLVDDSLGQLDCTVANTLKDFVTWGVSNYPADRYMLIFWNHGGGPVYGFGYDQWQGEYDALTIDEMQTAFRNAGVYFDFIGMDCCIMSSLEVCCALYDFCDYTILSEDFESGFGWSYTEWLKKLYSNTSITVPELGKSIVDSMISDNEKNSEEGILAVIDESVMKVLYSAWENFAYANESELLGTNYGQKRTRALGDRVNPVLREKGFLSDWLFGDSEDNVSLSDYYVNDIMAVAQNIDSDESKALSSALAKSIVYLGVTSGDSGLTGISVTLPYGDSDFYDELKTVFTNCGFDSEYISWLGGFVSASGSDDYYDYGSWLDDWDEDSLDDYEDDYSWDSDDYSIWDYLFGDWDDDSYDDMSDDYGWGWSDWDYDDWDNDCYDDWGSGFDDWNRGDDWYDDGFWY